MSRNRKKSLSSTIFLYVVYLIIIVVFLFPVLWVFSLSLRSLSEIFKYPPHLLPSKPTLENYAKVLHMSLIKRYFLNSFLYVTLTVLGTLIISIPASYAFSRMRNKAKGPILISILAFQMISPLIIAIPIYGYFMKLHLLDSYAGVIIAYIAIQLPFVTWLMKGYFDTIPISIEEAAFIDGCTRTQTLIKIILPLSVTGFATATIFTIIQSWSQFIIPFVILNSSKLFPVTLGLYQYQIGETIQTQLLAAASVISIIPAIVLFLILQKFIVKSLTGGAIKG